MSNEIIALEDKTAIEAFNDEAAFEALYAAIKEKAEEFTPDISSNKGRNELRSFAQKITKTKTRIDGIRSSLTEDMRAKVKMIDERGKTMRDRLDELKSEVRKPLTDWEDAEKLRVEEIRKTIDRVRELGQVKFGESSADIQKRMDDLPTHDLSFYAEFEDEASLVIETAFNQLANAKTAAQNSERDAEERKKQQEEIDRLRVAEAAREAADRKAKEEEDARRRAEEEAAQSRLRAAKEAEERAEAAERAAEAAEARAKVAEEAANAAAAEAEQRALDAAERERKRIAAEEEDKKRIAAEEEEARKRDAAEKKKRDADAKKQKALIIEEIASDLRTISSGRKEDIPEAIAEGIFAGEVRHVTFTPDTRSEAA